MTRNDAMEAAGLVMIVVSAACVGWALWMLLGVAFALLVAGVLLLLLGAAFIAAANRGTE